MEEDYDDMIMEDEILGLISELEEKFGISWLSACYPLNPELIRRTDSWKFLRKLEQLLKSAIREYPEDLVSGEPCPSTDIVSLLSLSSDGEGDHDLVRNNGERVSLNAATFKGKYVLVCCFHVPVLWQTRYFQSLLNLCNELYSIRDDFEMVMVARMIGVADTRAVFDHFFSAFPEWCLAVPYEDSKRRHHICNLLDLAPELDCIRCLFLNTDGSVLPPFVNADIMESYGAEAFPFTREIVVDIAAKQKQLRSLEQLLRPYESSPADVSIHKFNDPLEVVNISQLRNKHVGLYMYIDGKLLPRLNKVYKQCRKKQLDFEIVVLYCPSWEAIDPKSFQERREILLQKHDLCEWWWLPFNNSVSLRFSRLTERYYTGDYSDYGDKLIIVGHGGEILDLYGAKMIRYDVYPFTREAILDMDMKKLREITLESVLVDDVFRGNDRSDVISADKLVGKKKVIVYKTSLHYLDVDEDDYHYDDFQRLVAQYHEMKTNGVEFEVVFFNTDAREEEEEEDTKGGEEEEREIEDIETWEEEEGDTEAWEEEEEDTEAWEEEEEGIEDWEEVEVEEARKISAMPWYVYPRNGTRSASLIKLMKSCPDELLGFGVDGKLYSSNSWKFCLDDTLRQDISSRFQEYRDI